MITITVTADTAAQARDELRQLIGDATVPAPVEETKPTPKPRATKKADAPAAEPETPTSDAADTQADSGETSEAAAADVDLAPAAVKARAMAFSQQHGPGKLIDAQKQAGAPDGKWSQLEGDPARIAALSNLLQAEGF